MPAAVTKMMETEESAKEREVRMRRGLFCTGGVESFGEALASGSALEGESS